MSTTATDSFTDVFGTKRGPTTETQRQDECLTLDELREQRRGLEADIAVLRDEREELDVETTAARERCLASQKVAQAELEEQFEYERLQLVEAQDPNKGRRRMEYGKKTHHNAHGTAEEKDADKIARTSKMVLERRLRPAHRSDYEAWLSGYLATGKQSTHHYDYEFARVPFFVATKNFVMKPLYGSAGISIIVPSDVRCLGGQLGHCNLYFMKDFQTRSEGFILVPHYGDLQV